jgi:Bacterial Ig-like domain
MFVLAVAGLLAMFAGGALAQTAPIGTLDANNLGADPLPGYSFVPYAESSRESVVAQQFTAERTGTLTSTQVRLSSNTDLASLAGSLTMEITEVEPSGGFAGDIPARVLASTTIPASEITDHLVTGVFSNPAQVAAGQKYALVLKAENGGLGFPLAVSQDTYLGIDAWLLYGSWFNSPPLTWSGYGSLDLIFATYVSSPDTTPPSVTSTVPKANATEVAPTANVRATFSEEMDSNTIDGTTFKLFKKGSTIQMTATVSYNADTDTAKLDPTNNLRRGVAYKAVVTTEAKDVEGNRLDQDGSTSGFQQMRWFFRVDD